MSHKHLGIAGPLPGEAMFWTEWWPPCLLIPGCGLLLESSVEAMPVSVCHMLTALLPRLTLVALTVKSCGSVGSP